MASECYQIINIFSWKELSDQFVTDLFMLAEVNRNDYYAWLVRTDSISLRKERDYADYILMKRIHNCHKRKVSYRGLYMEMLDLIGGTDKS